VEGNEVVKCSKDEVLWQKVCIVMDLWLCSLYVGYCTVFIVLDSLSHCYLCVLLFVALIVLGF
jgi:hypothetical protein